MDFGGFLVLGIIWLLFNLIGQGKGRPPHAVARRCRSHGRQGAPDPTQREGTRLERLLRELERSLGGTWRRRPTAGPVKLPAPRRVEEEDVEERGSLEEPERVVSLETDVRPPRARGVRPGHRGRSDSAAPDRGGSGTRPRADARLTTRHSMRQIRQAAGGSHGGTAVHRPRSCGTRSCGGRSSGRRCLSARTCVRFRACRR